MTRQHNAPPWKSSVLALLRLQDEHGTSSSIKDIKHDARKIDVQLTHGGEAWRLFSVDLESLRTTEEALEHDELHGER